MGIGKGVERIIKETVLADCAVLCDDVSAIWVTAQMQQKSCGNILDRQGEEVVLIRNERANPDFSHTIGKRPPFVA